MQGALTVARTLRAAGFEAYYAGGCVRDKQLGIMPKDYDIVTDALPAQVGGLFKRSVMVGAAFGVVKVIIGRGLEYEIATYRHDGEYLDGRRPDRVTYSSDKDEDVHRRDFTINALLMDPETSEVIDLVDGLADLEAKLIRTVGDPEQRFAEDRLRMLRAVRFAARYDFAIHGDTADAIRLHASEIGDVSVERIVHEVHGIWDSKHPDLGAALLHSTGLTPAVVDFLSGHDEVEARHEIGVGNLMWTSDYPHPEGTWPESENLITEAFQGIPLDETRAMLGGNAAEVFGFDVEALAPITERIGPEVSALTDGGAPSPSDARLEGDAAARAKTCASSARA